MSGDGFAMPRRYTDEPDRPVPSKPPQQAGKPRPGHGTVYLRRDRDQAGNPVWTGLWIDDFGVGAKPHEPTFGRDTFEGTRSAAITWVRARPTPSRMVDSPANEGWYPLPDHDDDIEI